MMSAAVADYRPAKTASQKIKKNSDEFFIKLKPTKDILFELGKKSTKHRYLLDLHLKQIMKSNMQKRNCIIKTLISSL